MNYHGKLLHYSRNANSGEKASVISELPKRNDFLDPKMRNYVKKNVENRKTLFFLPNDLSEQHYKTPTLKHSLVLFGILLDGSKAALIVNNIDLFFDVRVPKGMSYDDFSSDIKGRLRADSIYSTEAALKRQRPFLLYQEESDYVRLYFNTTWQRRKAINWIREHRYQCNGEKISLETASDDLSSHYRKFAREYNIDLCDWNKIVKYRIDKTGQYANPNNVEYTIVVDAKNIRSLSQNEADSKLKAEKSYFRQDKSMILTWDIETYSNWFTGSAPDPDRIFDKEKGRESDIMFMDCMTAGWYYENKPFLQICLTEMPVPPREDTLIIQCDNQASMAEIKGVIMGRLAPEFVSGFNDGMYDWPFIINRMKAYDELERGIKAGKRPNANHVNMRDGKAYSCIEDFKRNASCLKYDEQTAKFSIRGEHEEKKIKIDAETYVDNTFFRVPGYIPMDVRTIFRRLMPSAEKTSLNFFLSVCKLGSKEDMPYQTMFKIYRMTRDFARDTGSRDYKKIMEYISDITAEYGDDYKYFDPVNVRERHARDKKSRGASANPFPQFDDSTYGVEKLMMFEIIEMMEQSTDVTKYCNVDAGRCHEMINIRNVIPDYREMANLSYTSMDDAVYKADGMKVRNLVITNGVKPEWNIAFTNISNGVKDDRKYPGAYVVPPKKGLYKDHALVKRKRVEIKNTPLDQFEGTWERSQIPEDENAKENVNSHIAGYGVSGQVIKRMRHEWIDPQHPKFDRKLINMAADAIGITKTVGEVQEFIDSQNKENQKRVPVDENDDTDRPCTGLDFSSLYPSEVMAWNLSPEMLIRDKAYAKALQAQGVRMIKVKVPYFRDGDPPESREIRVGWIIQHTPIEDEPGKPNRFEGMGLYPTLLKWLFDKRSSIKKLMGYWEEPKEFFEKVFESHPIAEIEKMSEDWQSHCNLVVDAAKKFVATQETALAEADTPIKRKFYKWKVHSAQEVLKFLETEWVATGVLHGKTVKAAYDEISFQFNYYNLKQLALKRFMNTFYGETGNSLSPFFAVEIAGGITTNGQKSIRLVKKFVEERGYRVLYGDTDSLYIACPEAIFEDIDRQYVNGEISKLDYWKAMIELTMEDLDKFKDEVNDMLYEDNGTRFLKMAYEEVLWPYAMVGKKKYIGVQHMGIVNLAICMPECTLADFMKSKSLFIRGLEIKKRGGSEFMKVNCYKVWKDAFCITETRTLREIVETNLQEILSHKWEPHYFARTKRYKLPDPGMPGNVSVLRFIARMQHLEKTRPDLEIFCPEVGERFPIVVAKKYPWKYGIRGTKSNLSIGDKMEFFDSLNNDKYCKYLEDEEGMPLEVDIDYYMTGEICGQFARFLLYHPDYDHYFQDWMYEDDDEYKKVDKKAHGEVKKILVNYYNTRFGSTYAQYGKIQQKVYKTVRSRVREDREVSYGSGSAALDMLDMLESVAFSSNNIEDDVEGEFVYKKSRNDMEAVFAKNIITKAKAYGRKCAEPMAKEIAEKMGISITEYRGRYFIPKIKVLPESGKHVKTCHMQRQVNYLTRELRSKERQLKNLTVHYKDVSEEDMASIGYVMKKIMQTNKIAEIFSQPVSSGADGGMHVKDIETEMQNSVNVDLACIDNEVIVFDNDEKIDLINQITECYYDIAAITKKLEEWKVEDEWLKDMVRIHRGRGDFVPSAVQAESETNIFKQWLSNKSQAGNNKCGGKDPDDDLFYI